MICFNAEDYLQRLKPISVALDKVKRDNCFMAQAVDAWKQLERDLEEVNQPLTVMKKAQERCSQALTPAHYLAHILDPTIAGNDLSGSEVASVMDYAAKTCPDLHPILINYRAKAEPFKEYLFSPSVVDSVTPLSWWKALQDRVGDKVMNTVAQTLGASASSAGVERIFSTFGCIHSNIRNRLGTEKAGKLVFIYKLLNATK